MFTSIYQYEKWRRIFCHFIFVYAAYIIRHFATGLFASQHVVCMTFYAAFLFWFVCITVLVYLVTFLFSFITHLLPHTHTHAFPLRSFTFCRLLYTLHTRILYQYIFYAHIIYLVLLVQNDLSSSMINHQIGDIKHLRQHLSCLTSHISPQAQPLLCSIIYLFLFPCLLFFVCLLHLFLFAFCLFL